MTDRQKLQLIEHLFDPKIDLFEIHWTTYYNEESEGDRILRIEYYDSGGNFHKVGITDIGRSRTYAI